MSETGNEEVTSMLGVLDTNSTVQVDVDFGKRLEITEHIYTKIIIA